MSAYGLLMRFPGGRRLALTVHYDDGVREDKRLIGILDEHGIRGTFNLSSGLFSDQWNGEQRGRMTAGEAVALYRDSGHEVAVHALRHSDLTQLPANMALHEVMQDRHTLERLFGVVIRGMAYPYGTFSEGLAALLGASGMAYARTTQSTEGFDLPADWLRMPITCRHVHPELMALLDRFLEPGPYDKKPRLFTLMGHSYEFTNDDNWHVIESFARKAGRREEVWYAPAIEICDYVEGYRRLRFSCDGALVSNPSAMAVYFDVEDTPFCVQPGQTLALG